MHLKALCVSLLGVCLVPLATSAQPMIPADSPTEVVPGASEWAPGDRARERMEPPLEMRTSAASMLSVAGPPPAVLAEGRATGRPLRIGEPLDLIQASVSRLKVGWHAREPGRLTARLAVQAVDAEALRVGLQLSPARDMHLRVQGSAARQIFSLDSALFQKTARDVVWTPVTQGDTQEIELTIDAPAGQAPPRILVRQLSAFARHPAEAARSPTRDVRGLSLPAAKDDACSESVNCLPDPPAAFRNASSSVVRLIMTRQGVSFSCTGTLVNDLSFATRVPYVLTAAHCVDSAETAATVNAVFFYKTLACGSDAIGPAVQLASGASLMYVNLGTDVALIRLNDLAPPGAFFSGWDPQPLDPGNSLLMIHHPHGSPQAFAVGTTLPASLENDFSGDHMLVSWLTGTSDGGSSGAPMFTLQNGQYVLRGVLHGGRALCAFSGDIDSPLNRDFFSRLDKDAAGLRSVLQRAAAPLHDYSDVWIPVDELGWGLTLYQGDLDRLLLAWYTHDEDGLPVWYLSLGGRWTSATRFEGEMARVMNSPALGPYDPSRLSTVSAGNLVLNFSSRTALEATFNLPAGSRTKTLKRFRF